MEQNYCKKCGRVIYEGESSYANVVRYQKGRTHSTREDGVICQECYEEKVAAEKKEDKQITILSLIFFPFSVAWWIVKHVFLILLFIITLGNFKK